MPKEVKPSRRTLENEIREKIFALICPVLAAEYDEILVTDKLERTVPVVDRLGNEGFAVISIKIPHGTRETLTEAAQPYDGYAVAELYREEVAQKEEENRAKEAIREREAKVRAQKRKKPTVADVCAQNEGKEVSVKVRDG